MDGPGSALLDRVVRLGSALREAGVPVSTSELIDACAAATHLDLADRTTFRAGLRATLAKDELAVARFDRTFDRVFAGAAWGDGAGPGGSAGPDRHGAGRGPALPAGARPGTLPADVLAALAAGDDAALALLAAAIIEQHAGPDGPAGTERQLLHRALRAVDLTRMLAAAMQRLRSDGGLDELELFLRRRELTAAIERFRRLLAEEIARRGHALDHGSSTLPPAAIDRDILGMSATEAAELRRVVQPLARQLAARVGRRRRPRPTGRIDLRRTVRRSLETGGVPLDPQAQRRRPHRADVVLLCDLSGSVADFARFTFTLVHAVHEELAQVRSFAFVDGVAEVTDLVTAASFEIPVAVFLERRGVLGPDGHSDYGRVFGQLVAPPIVDVLTARTTVIVTGDARCNHRDPGLAALRSLRERVRRVYWLNPEPVEEWDDGDSVIGQYRPWCDGVHEVRTLRQLADVVGAIV